MTISRIRRAMKRTSFDPSDSSFTAPSEIAAFVHTWCDVIDRLGTQQLRNRGEALLEIWCATGGEGHDLEDADSWEMLTGKAYPPILRKIADRYRRPKPPGPSPLERRIAWLSDTLEFDRIEHAIVLVLARCAAHVEWLKLIHALPGTGHQPSISRIALLANLPPNVVEDRLGVGARLWNTGLIYNDGDGEVSPENFLRRVARSAATPSRLARQFMPTTRASNLSWEDFAHIGPQREIAEALVKQNSHAPILLYGPPGTGKTEFARLLAARAGMRAAFAGSADDSGKEPSRRERLAHMSLLRALTRGDPTRIVVMDEADDILQLGVLEERGHRSKLFLNNLVEGGERPTIWIVNEPRRFEESLIRRMALAIEFPRPSLVVRRRIVDLHTKKAKLKLGEDGAHRLASLPAAPAVIASAVRGAKAAGGAEAEAVAIGEGLVGAISGRAPGAVVLPAAYDPALALADRDLEALARQLEAGEDRGWSLLLSGPSGTGKSAYARHLAERLQIELVERRGSDLLGMFVGETEANIAAAFHEAARCKGLLLIDEADDFLSDRRSAERRWERSMVNEMLRQMEALKAPFVATTNLADGFDPATQRRFTIRAEFRPLDERRALAQFRIWFGLAPPAGVSVDGLTPGDFALVAHRAKLVGEDDLAVISAWLQDERAARGGGSAGMGF